MDRWDPSYVRPPYRAAPLVRGVPLQLEAGKARLLGGATSIHAEFERRELRFSAPDGADLASDHVARPASGGRRGRLTGSSIGGLGALARRLAAEPDLVRDRAADEERDHRQRGDAERLD